MKKLWTIIRYVVGAFFALGAVAEAADSITFVGWSGQAIFGVFVSLLIARECFRPLVSFGTFLRYMVGGYFVLAAVIHVIWTATHVAQTTWYWVDITCIQFLIALAFLWPLLLKQYKRVRSERSMAGQNESAPRLS